jgi:hypothetical protein
MCCELGLLFLKQLNAGMEEITSYNLKRIINGRPFYAQIGVRVEMIHKRYALEIVFDYFVEEYKEALIFGAKYFHEHYYKQAGHNRGLRVTVVHFHYMDVDTTSVVCAYVMVKALSQALNAPIDGFELDETTGIFNFPR